VSSLIRDVVQVHVLIHDDPNNALTEEPWRWQSFALHPDSLAGRWKVLQEKAARLGLEWVCKQAVAIPEGDADADNKQKTKYTWVEIPTSDKQDRIAATLRKALMVVLPSQLATYHEELGFVLLDDRLDISSTGYQSVLLPKRAKEKSQYAALRQQSYQEHIQGLVNAYNRGIRQNIQYVVEQLERQIGIPSGSVDQAIRLALACHDLGKLGEQWQQWAWEWQTLLFKRQRWPTLPSHPYFFAKTDFDFHSPDYRKWREEMKTRRPAHACEGVAVGMELIAESLYARVGEEKCEMLLRAVCGAIAHHHTADAHTYGTIKLKQGAIGAVKEALEQARQQLAWTYDLSHLNVSQVEGDDLAPATVAPSDAYITKPRQGRLAELETWLYFVIVRALRLADQRADVFGQI
jgi:CRISPR-associated endonuclease/helicase Cas3